MAYPIRVRPQAEGEIIEAMAWYEARSPGLGQDFYRTFLGTLMLISEHPRVYRKVRGDSRRVVFRRFPYALFYAFEEGEIVVLSCIHESRSPEAWPERS